MRKVLVANRGEIALRIIRACHELGLAAVAVYSDADAGALHARAADEAYRLGPAPSTESYLRIDRLIEIARQSGADAVHPGYGFLAERAEFARACLDAGLIFVGPPPGAVEAMGDKVRARQAVIAHGVPTVPGTTEEVADLAEAAAVAERIGYPVMLKAAAGGGGKGMRVVGRPDELEAALRQASNEARAAFGHGGLYVEKLLTEVRHVEIQVLADAHGNVIHLGERECSIQRRHQKLIEEAPSAALDPELRARMGEAAVAAARSVGYVNAGTVEFLLTPEREFYFLEMNTRLQVEHPVTELVTGIDLVQAQMRVAAGEPLPWRQADIALRGHAIECRLSAEDPRNGFLPSIGRVRAVREPSGPGVRVDSALYPGLEVSLYYDPMLAKLIVWAPTREGAIARMQRALGEVRVLGIATNVDFHRAVMADARFRAGELSTAYLDTPPPLPEAGAAETAAAVAAALLEHARRSHPATALSVATGATETSNWRVAGRLHALRRL